MKAAKKAVYRRVFGFTAGLLFAAACGSNSDEAPVTRQGAPAQVEPVQVNETAEALPDESAVEAEEGQESGEPALPGIENPSQALASRLQAAITARGSDYEPRTHHRQPDGSARYTNRLALESSPYLLQHAHNPVNWYPWGAEAFRRAQELGRPVLLSVGYSTCHWCHVMERESFEDVEIARVINENFVAIKVDREERPDIDEIYMRAVQLMTGRGGWPMTVVMTPSRQPFFGGTYFPARDGDRGARVGFLTLLRDLSERFSTRRTEVVRQATELSERMRRMSQPTPPGDIPTASLVQRLSNALIGRYDPTWGGYGSAPKFPQASRLIFMMRYVRRARDGAALPTVMGSLDAMAQGGIYDQVGGGFHRYSTDAQWLVPHFEKMLYDNAQLAVVYTEAFQLTGQTRFARVVDQVLTYVSREMTAPSGGFYSATDADSANDRGETEEGYYFTWTPSELRDVLGARQARFAEDLYGVEAGGNFEGRSILFLPRSLDAFAQSRRRPAEGFYAQVDEIREALYSHRQTRSPPLRDDKVLTSWNGLMISAFARGGLVLRQPAYIARARAAADFVLRELRTSSGRLRRSYVDGRARHNAYLDDYAMLIEGLLDLYEATGEARWMQSAIELQAVLDRDFLDERRGGYFMTSRNHEALIVRDRPIQDGALPSGNGVATLNLLRLDEFTGNVDYRTRAESMFRTWSQPMSRNPMSVPRMVVALDYYLDKPYEIVIVHPNDASQAEQLLQVVRSMFLPNRILSVVSEDAAREQSELLPVLENKVAIDGEATAYVCEQGVCQRPTSDPATLREQLSRVQRYQGIP